MEDSKDLRLDFIRESGLALDTSWFDDGCSVLEMLVGFSRQSKFPDRYSRTNMVSGDSYLI